MRELQGARHEHDLHLPLSRRRAGRLPTGSRSSRTRARSPRSPNDGLTKHRLIELMIGRDATELAEGYEDGVDAAAAGRRPRRCSRFRSSDVRRRVPATSRSTCMQGEILGMFGYLGARNDGGRAGAVRSDSTRRTARSCSTAEPIRPRSPTQAKRLGIAYLTENRRATIFPRHEIYKNITLAHLDHLVPAVFPPHGRDRRRRPSGQADRRPAGEPAHAGRAPERRQPAKSRAREVAHAAAEGADPERADARHGRRRQAGGARSDQGAQGARAWRSS